MATPITANPPLTHMYLRTKTQTVQHHVTSLCNKAKALYTVDRDCSPSRKTSLQRRCVFVCRGVASEECVFGHLKLPFGGAPDHKDRNWNSRGIKLPSRSPWALVTEGSSVVSAVKHRREQQCFFAFLDWPPDILDTSRCVRCFRVIFFFR